jgi:hypothetical protein
MLPLTTTPDQTQLEAFGAIVRNRRCVVVGSAPLPTKHARTDPGEVVICVNGAISSVAGVPDIWVLNSKPSAASLHLTMCRQGANRAVKHIAFLRSPIRPTEDESLTRLRKMGASCESWSVIDKPVKRWIEQTICDRRDHSPGVNTACSAGIFTVALALWSGASRVRLAGFSWSAGYHYLPKLQVIRGHVDADQRALRVLLDRYPGLLLGAIVPQAAAVAS